MKDGTLRDWAEPTALTPLSEKLSRGIHNAVLSGGKPTRKIADFLHGTWLGHPLHPVLTDVVVGAWVLTSVFDFLGKGAKKRKSERIADALCLTGVVSAVPTAMAGLADYSTVPKNALSAATMHALINDVNLVTYSLSSLARARGHRKTGVALAGFGLGMLAISAYLGGYLVYAKKVGVNHTPEPPETDEWTDLIAENDLEIARPLRITVKEYPILLYKTEEGAITAIAAVCSHAGGPLEQGRFDGCTVQCPWHDSVFDLRTGEVVHGPATHPQPAFETRIFDGRIQIRERSKS